jgi:hypothetical protein
MKVYKILVLVIVFVASGIFIGKFINPIEYKAEEKVTTKSDLEKIMEEESFKKATILRARKVANDQKKDIETERNKQAINSIEAEYEAIRAEELALVGTSSLK